MALKMGSSTLDAGVKYKRLVEFDLWKRNENDDDRDGGKNIGTEIDGNVDRDVEHDGVDVNADCAVGHGDVGHGAVGHGVVGVSSDNRAKESKLKLNTDVGLLRRRQTHGRSTSASAATLSMRASISNKRSMPMAPFEETTTTSVETTSQLPNIVARASSSSSSSSTTFSFSFARPKTTSAVTERKKQSVQIKEYHPSPSTPHSRAALAGAYRRAASQSAFDW